MKVVPGLEMARKVPKIVFEIWGNFRFSLNTYNLSVQEGRNKCEVFEVSYTLSTRVEIPTDIFQYKLFSFFFSIIVSVH